MEAIILAAGLGTRLRPLTDSKPKALVEVNGRTLLELCIERLASEGTRRIVVNVHHFGDMMIDFISNRKWDTEVVISDERSLLLNTGGGVRKAASLLSLNEPILVHNVDILSNISLKEIITRHLENSNIATLAVSQRNTNRQLLFDQDGLLCGWRNREKDETLWTDHPVNTYKELAFSGIWAIDPSLVELLPPADHPYSIIPELLKVAKEKKVSHFEHLPSDWLDVGSPAKLAAAPEFMHHGLNN